MENNFENRLTLATERVNSWSDEEQQGWAVDWLEDEYEEHDVTFREDCEYVWGAGHGRENTAANRAELAAHVVPGWDEEFLANYVADYLMKRWSEHPHEFESAVKGE
ncbi:MAG: hypothetical protein ACPGU1_20435 [Myxococcota bacterium]